MPSGDVVVSVIAGGQLNQVDQVNSINTINQIDLIKKIQYPESLIPDVDVPGTKGFRINITEEIDIAKTAIHQFNKNVYISSVSVTCTTYNDLDYWELEINGDKMCETIYTLDCPVNSNSVVGFQIFPKVMSGTDIIFTFHNNSAIPKKVWMTLGYMYKSI